MKKPLRHSISVILLLLVVGVVPAGAAILIQCPTDTVLADGVTPGKDGISDDPNVLCLHQSSGDGFTKMADGYDQYIFSFARVPADMATADVVSNFTGRANSPAPTIKVRQGQELYLSLTNVGMIMRPDLFDSHSVHWHGFINAGSVFDGVPEVSPAAAMQATQPYYYNAVKEGTFFYHCHVEAAEHMQMGMIGNLYVEAGQDLLSNGATLGTWVHTNTGDADNPPYGNFPGPEDEDNGTTGVFDEGTHDRYVYSDGDGSTYYDVSYPIQLTTFDSDFHDASLAIQPLPFADMKDNYFLINGRGYPDTVNPGGIVNNASEYWSTDYVAQPVNALITASAGDKISLRLSNVSTTDLISVATTLGVPMRVVGRGAELMRGPDPDGNGPLQGKDVSYELSVLNIGGGQAADVIIDTAGVPAGTYFLYTTNLQFLSNNAEERGGIMTEIILN
jgi:FtsP/CotA-like multicopper oxidase with cupredoxin domain